MEDENISPIQQANKVLADLKAENDRRERLLGEEQKMQSERMLSGTAGGRVEPVVKVETPQEYASKVMRGEIKLK